MVLCLIFGNMAKYLLDESEALRLADRIARLEAVWPDVKHNQKDNRASHFPFRFKLLESFSSGKANAAIWFFGDSTSLLYKTTDVYDDSSKYTTASSGDKGICLASSEFFVLHMDSTVTVSSTATEYLGLATTNYSSTEADVICDNLEPLNGTGTTLNTLTCLNRFAWPIKENGSCYFKYNEYTSEFVLIQTWCEITGGSSTPSIPTT